MSSDLRMLISPDAPLNERDAVNTSWRHVGMTTRRRKARTCVVLVPVSVPGSLIVHLS
jgi:hypothetical protein